MKRPKNNSDFELKQCLPIFSWCTCSKCNDEFRFETGWSFCKKPEDGQSDFRYMCKECAPDWSAALTMANEYFEHGPQLAVPPPIPVKK